MSIKEKIRERKIHTQKEEKRSAIREDMRKIEEEIKQNEVLFNLATDEHLIDSLIFEHNAKEAKLRYLLSLAKEI